MCLIALQTPGAALAPDAMSIAWSKNHDGGGYMFAHDGELTIRKPFFKLREFIRAYNADYRQFGASSPFVVHWRYATHGEQDETNTHPHLLDCGVGFAHNGILSDFTPPWRSKLSDTAWFARTVLVRRHSDTIVDDAIFADQLAAMIGTGNKLVFLRGDGKSSIINETAGHWDGGVWYSNDSYVRRAAPVYIPPLRQYRTAAHAWNTGKLPAHYGRDAYQLPSSTCGLWEDDTLAAEQELREELARLEVEERHMRDALATSSDDVFRADYLRIVERIQEIEIGLADIDYDLSPVA